MKLAIIRTIGFVLAMLGIGGLAGWTEMGTGLGISLIFLVVGIFLLWEENRMNPIDRKWEQLAEESRHSRKRY